MPRHVEQSWRDFLGPGALMSFSLAALTALLGLGLPVLWRLRQVLTTAGRDERHAVAADGRAADAVLVLGRQLVDERPSPVFLARLEHGVALWRDGLAPRLIVAGGLTGTAQRTEAAVAREVLLELGVPDDRIDVEDASSHTLENLFNVRERLRQHGWRRLIVVSDPLHLARVSALARGLGLDFGCSPATASPPRRGSVSWWWRAGREAYLLHWYHVGIAYSRAIGSKKLLRRVT